MQRFINKLSINSHKHLYGNITKLKDAQLTEAHENASLSYHGKYLGKAAILCFLLAFNTACDIFIKNEGIPQPVTGNPGINANLSTSFPAITPTPSSQNTNNVNRAANPSDNQIRLTVAQRQTQTCPDSLESPCTMTDDRRIELTYLAGLIDETVELETGIGSDEVSYEKYFYASDNPNRLDKLAKAESSSSNFNLIRDFTYDDENDVNDKEADIEDARDNNSNNDNDGYNANLDITIPKIRKEYICDELDLDVIAAQAFICDRSNATEVVDYIYYANGVLFRKEFDSDNDTEIEYQDIYYYEDNILTRVDNDNFYNGMVDSRITYTRDQNDALTVAVNTDVIAGDDLDYVVSYRLNSGSNGEVLTECYFRRGFPLDGNEDTNSNCSIDPSSGSRHDFHWIFTWETNNCWTGGLDDINPEARAIEYLCKQP